MNGVQIFHGGGAAVPQREHALAWTLGEDDRHAGRTRTWHGTEPALYSPRDAAAHEVKISLSPCTRWSLPNASRRWWSWANATELSSRRWAPPNAIGLTPSDEGTCLPEGIFQIQPVTFCALPLFAEWREAISQLFVAVARCVVSIEPLNLVTLASAASVETILEGVAEPEEPDAPWWAAVSENGPALTEAEGVVRFAGREVRAPAERINVSPMSESERQQVLGALLGNEV